jgi:uncharacterized protein (TIGR02246 family)
MRGARIGVCILAAALAAAGAHAETPVVSRAAGVEAHSGIDGVYEQFAAAYDRLDPEAVAALYTEEALYLAPGSDVRRGRAAIRDVFAGFFDWVRGRPGGVAIRFEILARRVSGDLAYDVGYYRLRSRGPEGESEDRGKFVVVALRGADGAWRFAVDGYSGLEPPVRGE